MTAKAVKVKPKYSATAAELLERCREFYQDPENEKAFREWQRQIMEDDAKGRRRDLVI